MRSPINKNQIKQTIGELCQISFVKAKNSFLTAVSILLVSGLLSLQGCDKEKKSNNVKKDSKIENKKTEFKNAFLENLKNKNVEFSLENPLHIRLLKEYGVMFFSNAEVPPKPLMTEDGVAEFQNKKNEKGESFFTEFSINGIKVKLQTLAAEALQDAIAEAKSQNLTITPISKGLTSARSYSETMYLWKRTLEPAINYWNNKGIINDKEVQAYKKMNFENKVLQVLKWEEELGIKFGNNFSESILHSVAIPGASQHNALIAFDIKEYKNPKIREILAKYGWFQTVDNDEPHFVFIGKDFRKLTDEQLATNFCLEKKIVKIKGVEYLFYTLKAGTLPKKNFSSRN